MTRGESGAAGTGQALARGPEIEFRDVHSRWGSAGAVEASDQSRAALRRAGERDEALAGLSLRLAPGQITVLLGDHKSGKSLLALHLLGELAPDRGAVLVDGQSLWEMPEPRRLEVHDSFGVLRGGTGIRESKIDFSASVADNLTEQLRHQPNGLDHVQTSQEWLDHYDLVEFARKVPDELDSGARRRLAVALALAGDPAVVVIDDPGQAMDSTHLRHMMESIKGWHARTGATMLITVHSLTVARELGHQVAVLRDGCVAAQGRPEDVLDGVDDDASFEQRFGTGLGGFAEADPQRLHQRTNSGTTVHGWGRSYLDMARPMGRKSGFN